MGYEMDNPDFDIYHGSLYARFDYIAIKARKLQDRQERLGYQKLSRSMLSKSPWIKGFGCPSNSWWISLMKPKHDFGLRFTPLQKGIGK
ncbi:hypothetical protein EMCG_09167 [[Emmonsia] crescens]|uniref:Uncharacterized protein n=1 Tax=[Emmonsia] crescens TaxID=73230 RepID=A0A0G2I3J0_9EURO|nr:hypothetical protein EMCG_09167 [Emmonsia crescens UAMH 3008]